MESLTAKLWHHLSASQTVEVLETSPETGLAMAEVERRVAAFGPNALTARRGKSAFMRFLLQFHQPLIYVLLLSGVITALLGEVVDSSVIIGVVLVNAVVGYIQEAKAAGALEALARSMVAEAEVVRAGVARRIGAVDLVPGDVVLLRSGDKVPADVRLVAVKDLRVDESALTGESLPVSKGVDQLPPETVLADRINMAYASTLVTYGTATGVVVATGDATEIGRISTMVHEADELATPLTRRIEKFSHLLLWAIMGLAVLTFVAGVARGEKATDMFMAAVALAVGAIPEGLPAAVTVILAIGVSRMAARGAIIRNLPAVETLGGASVICSDKTGTLTENQMTVTALYAGGRRYAVTGGGYRPEGNILPAGAGYEAVVDTISGQVAAGQGVPGQIAVGLAGGAPAAQAPAMMRSDQSGHEAGPLSYQAIRAAQALHTTLLAGLLCNDTRIEATPEGDKVAGDPTEAALLVAATKAGLVADDVQQQWPRQDALPFESEHQYMATLHTGDADGVVFFKGSVESVLARADRVLLDDGSTEPLDHDALRTEVERMAGQGMRVLALAQHQLANGVKELAHEHVASGLVLVGLQGMIDPPRAEAVAAVAAFHGAGVQVKMITGDHAITAAAIGQQIGLGDASCPGNPACKVLTGAELEALSDEELVHRAADTAIFARVAPEQKLRLVMALQSRGEVVSMTGDGVNDAPALKQADIGVAMGRGGTEAAKEAADMVLTDDNFATIKAAVEEGRGVYDNLLKFIVWTLPTNLGEGLVIVVAVLFGVALPILPVQILWINMTTASILGIMLAFEPMEPGIMQRKPRNPQHPILDRNLLQRIALVGALLLVAAFGLYQWELVQGHTQETARTVAVNVFVLVQTFYLFNSRSFTRSPFELGIMSNPWVVAGALLMLVLQLAFTYVPVMNRLFGSAPIGVGAWLNILAVSVVAYGVVELEKRWRRRMAG